MYTIKQASLRTGVSVPLLRAWERRYGIPRPARTAARYRLYDEAALDDVRRLRGLVEAGWAPRQAAEAILEGRAPDLARLAALRGEAADRDEAASGRQPGPAGSAGRPDSIPIEVGGAPPSPIAWLLGEGVAAAEGGGQEASGREGLVAAFVAAARSLDEARLERALDEAVAGMGVDVAVTSVILPALVGVGDAWARGELDVAAEHAASNAVMRRLGMLYEAAGQPSTEPAVVVGLPPNGRHEAGALAFALACRRAGLSVLYLGADVPLESWRAVARAHPHAAVVLGAVSPGEAQAAGAVAAALHLDRPDLLVACGGGAAPDAVPGPELGGIQPGGCTLLGGGLRESVAMLRELLRR